MVGRKIIALSFALALTACGSAEQSGKPATASSAAAISVETLKSVTQQLSSDSFEGREPGTPGEERTLAYLVEQFQAAGLKPGNNGSWFQNVPLVELTRATSVRSLSPAALSRSAWPMVRRWWSAAIA